MTLKDLLSVLRQKDEYLEVKVCTVVQAYKFNIEVTLGDTSLDNAYNYFSELYDVEVDSVYIIGEGQIKIVLVPEKNVEKEDLRETYRWE